MLLRIRKLALFMLSEFRINVIMEALLLDFTNPKQAFSYVKARSTKLMLLLSNGQALRLENMVS
jgi:hypothetical protein